MKKMIVLIAAAFLAMPMIASADLVGECYDCHTMHNSEQNEPVVAGGPLPNLLRYECLGCHAVPGASTKNVVGPGGSTIPQVAHSNADTLAGGKFNQTANRKVHNVQDITDAGIMPAVGIGDTYWDQPPGIPHTSNRHVFTSEGAANAFDMFTCAGARGCHGTRSQIIAGATVDNGTANNWEVAQRRTGMAAISGSHHNNVDGEAKTSTGYDDQPAVHDGTVVADGYRFIVGLQGYENTARDYINNTDHNEYFGNVTDAMGSGCGACHVQDTAQSNTRAAFESGIVSINNSMSGFCSSCHGYFHSSGGQGGADFNRDDEIVATSNDYVFNGFSGAFLRHPSDYVLPTTGDYQYYTQYFATAPVARPTVPSVASNVVTPGTDMVMCLSCHVAHGSEYNYLLRFDYANMVAGQARTEASSQAQGGCLACHSSKGSAPGSRIR